MQAKIAVNHYPMSMIHFLQNGPQRITKVYVIFILPEAKWDIEEIFDYKVEEWSYHKAAK